MEPRELMSASLRLSALVRPTFLGLISHSGNPLDQGSTHSPSLRMALPGSQHHQGKPGGWGMGEAPGLRPNLNLWSQSKENAPPYPMGH